MEDVPRSDPVARWATADAVTVDQDESVGSARALMLEQAIQHLVVVGEGRVIGVLSDRDVLAALTPMAANAALARQSDLATLNKRVHQVMSHRLVAVSREMPVREAVSELVTRHIHCLPIVGLRGEPAGIFTTSDALRWALACTDPETP